MITILIGVSGSGKTTFSKNLLDSDNNLSRVNRDCIRELLFGVTQTDDSYYKRGDFNKCEKLVSEVSEQIIYDLILSGRDVIIDNTNLKLSYINEILNKFNHLSPISILIMHSDRDSELKEFKRRLVSRYGVDETKISYVDRQWKEFKKLKKELHGKQCFYPQVSSELIFDSDNKDVVLVDIDGTVARKGDRDIYDDSKLHLDTVITPVARTIKALEASGVGIIYVSGRQDTCHDTTKEWLKNNGLWFKGSKMFMRKENDLRPDYIVKEEIILNKILPKFNVLGVFDDRLSVTRAYYKLGIFTFNVNQNMIKF